ncbi:MAG TPA: 6-phosphogluconolactonase, partial [Ignavibacteriaceae bacterium]
MNYKIQISETVEELSEQFAQLLIDKVNNSKDKFNIALSGGSTPKNIFEYLVAHHHDTIEWHKVNFFWGDERCVPPNDSESNYKMAYEAILSRLQIPDSNIFRIRGENDPQNEAKEYSEIVVKQLPQINNIPKFDLIMLGLGEDGHTASLFPNQKSLLESEKIYATAVHPETGQKRITLTGRVINNALTIVFIVTGINKAKVVNEIINQKENYKYYPASSIKS